MARLNSDIERPGRRRPAPPSGLRGPAPDLSDMLQRPRSEDWTAADPRIVDLEVKRLQLELDYRRQLLAIDISDRRSRQGHADRMRGHDEARATLRILRELLLLALIVAAIVLLALTDMPGVDLVRLLSRL